MQTTIELQPKPEQHLARWKQLGADRELAKLPFKIETDRLGRILMSPPPFFDHVRRVATILELLHAHMHAGKVLAETLVVTSDGVKVTDAHGFPPSMRRSSRDRTRPPWNAHQRFVSRSCHRRTRSRRWSRSALFTSRPERRKYGCAG